MSGGLFRKSDLVQWSPRLTNSSAIEKLRLHLEHGYLHHGSVFGEDAKKDLTDLVSAALLECDTVAAKEGGLPFLYDRDDPQSSNNGARSRSSTLMAQDSKGHWQPWSLRSNQARGEARRRTEGRNTWQKPKGKMCGKVLKRNNRYYTCK